MYSLDKFKRKIKSRSFLQYPRVECIYESFYKQKGPSDKTIAINLHREHLNACSYPK